MQIDELTAETARRLAETRAPSGRVVSLYLDLDPTRFATPPARASEIRSLLDDADRRVKEADDGLSHDERVTLRSDLDRVDEFLHREFSADGAHGLAVFCSSPAGLFEAIKLPRRVDSAVVLADTPFIEPLARLLGAERWCVALVNRRAARVLAGSPDVLEEQTQLWDDVPGQHDQGGWSQARYERSIEEDVASHLKRAADALFEYHRDNGFDHLLVGAPVELRHDFEEKLHASLKEKLVGFVEVDVEHASPEDVREAAAIPMQQHRRAREREALDRLTQGVRAGGRGASGLDDVLGALNERRVEILLIEPGFRAAGSVCRTCGWVGSIDGGVCPVDGAELEPRDDVVESAIELALRQSAQVMIPSETEDLGSMGSIGAVLRF